MEYPNVCSNVSEGAKKKKKMMVAAAQNMDLLRVS